MTQINEMKAGTQSIHLSMIGILAQDSLARSLELRSERWLPPRNPDASRAVDSPFADERVTLSTSWRIKTSSSSARPRRGFGFSLGLG